MKISSVQSNNINFGYNKNLNASLIKRLKQDEELSLNQILLKINDTCNFTEQKLKELEKDGVDKNSQLMKTISDYFINLKLSLSETVHELFPELNYAKRECASYEKEIFDNIDPNSEQTKQKQSDEEYFMWREIIVDGLGSIVDDEDVDYYDDDDDDYYNVIEEEIEKPNVEVDSLKFVPGKHSPKSLDDVVGLDKTIKDIKNYVLFPLTNKEAAKKREEEYGIEIPNFVVFSGPPGCGKTMLAEAIAQESKCDMYKINLSQMGSIYVNGTVKNISSSFDKIKKIAKNSDKPVLVFMDEMDSILSKRSGGSDGGSAEDSKVVNALLPIITSTTDSNIILLGATNMYNSIDSAVKRRIDMNIYIGLPKEQEIQKLLNKNLSKIKMGKTLASNEEELKELSTKLVGYSPSNIVSLTKEASKIAYSENREIKKDDYMQALKDGVYEKIKEENYLPEVRKRKKVAGFS